jgi:hypothetical protein
MPGRFFVILNELLGEEESLLLVRKDENYDWTKVYNYDSSIGYAGFFTAFRMTCQGGFRHSQRVLLFLSF